MRAVQADQVGGDVVADRVRRIAGVLEDIDERPRASVTAAYPGRERAVGEVIDLRRTGKPGRCDDAADDRTGDEYKEAVSARASPPLSGKGGRARRESTPACLSGFDLIPEERTTGIEPATLSLGS